MPQEAHQNGEDRPWAGVTNLTAMRRNAAGDCEAKPDNEYTRFVDGMPHQRHKRGTGLTNDIDRDALDLGDLAVYFAGLDAGKLATVWVPCFIDCLQPDQLGSAARALCVVAERLHGIAWTEPKRVACPAHALHGGTPMAFKIETTTPPMTAKEAAKYPQHVRDAAETIASAPAHWRWFLWPNCPAEQMNVAAKLLRKAIPESSVVRVYLSAENAVIVENMADSGRPRDGSPASAVPRSEEHRGVGNVAGRRLESQRPRILAALAGTSTGRMTMTELMGAMDLANAPRAAVDSLEADGLVRTDAAFDGGTNITLTEKGEEEAKKAAGSGASQVALAAHPR